MDPDASRDGRGAFQLHRRFHMSGAGAIGKADVGISNDKADEKSARRKSKGS